MPPAWIGSRKQIVSEIEHLREQIKGSWDRHSREYRIIRDAHYRDSLVISWDDTCQFWEKRIVQINKTCLLYTSDAADE